MTRVRVRLPAHLRALAEVEAEVAVEVEGPPTVRSTLDALEARHPVLRGTIRNHGGGARRGLIRFYACGRDLSLETQDTPLPAPVAAGEEPLQVVGAIAGG